MRDTARGRRGPGGGTPAPDAHVQGRSTRSSTRSPTTRRGSEEGYLFWASWLNHAGAAIFGHQDAHGPVRRGIVLIDCPTLGRARGASSRPTPQLDLLDPAAQRARPSARRSAPTGRRRRLSGYGQGSPQRRPDGRDDRVRALVRGDPAVPVARLRRLGAAAAGGLPLQGQVPRGHPARPGGRRADLGRERRARSRRRSPTERRASTETEIEMDDAYAPIPATPRRSCARRRCSARPTWSSRPATARQDAAPTAAAGRGAGVADGRARRDLPRASPPKTRRAFRPGWPSRGAAVERGRRGPEQRARPTSTPFAEDVDDVLKILDEQERGDAAARARHGRGVRRAQRAPGPAARPDQQLEPRVRRPPPRATASWRRRSWRSRPSSARRAPPRAG